MLQILLSETNTVNGTNLARKYISNASVSSVL